MESTGKLDQLERYCARDAEALAELVTRAWTRVPGGGGTDRVGVAKWMCMHGARKRECDCEDDAGGERSTRQRTMTAEETTKGAGGGRRRAGARACEV